MRISLGIFFLCAVITINGLAQELRTKNVIIITIDGYRWQELFQGADPRILSDTRYVKDTTVQNLFNGETDQVRRAALMPFFWTTLGKQGQLYGNRKFKNRVNCTNNHLISYPGYSEMLVGFVDPKVSSNDNIENPNATVLEFIHQEEAFKNRVAAFATWNAFPYILRENKGIPVNAGSDLAEGNLSEKEKWLNENRDVFKNPYGPRYDSFTFHYALEYMKRERPRVVFIGFEETDTQAHDGRYDEYLKSAHNIDKMIGALWHWIQSQPDYKDQTTVLITTDHGRGKGKNTWRNHRLLATGSRQIWFAVMGPDTPSFGEMKFRAKYYQKQVAKTIAAFLGLQYSHEKPVGDVVQTMMAVPKISIDDASADSSPAYDMSNEK